jgi:hypothetical protein
VDRLAGLALIASLSGSVLVSIFRLLNASILSRGICTLPSYFQAEMMASAAKDWADKIMVWFSQCGEENVEGS